MAVQLQVVFDAADPPALAAFWGEAIGYKEEDPPDGFDSWEALAVANDLPPEERDNYASRVDPDGVGPRLFFQRGSTWTCRSAAGRARPWRRAAPTSPPRSSGPWPPAPPG